MSRRDVEDLLNMPFTLPQRHTFASDELDTCCSAAMASRVLRRWVTSRYMPPQTDQRHPLWAQCYDTPLPIAYEAPTKDTYRRWLYIGDVGDRPGAQLMQRSTWHLCFTLPVDGAPAWRFYVPVGFMWDKGRPSEEWLAEQE